ncbi:MAG TPA: hypothetical protein VGH63_17875 [Polyangia bacterium]|jgi:hypothetical protein
MSQGTYIICTDLGDGITTLTPYGFSVDVSAEVRRWRAFEKRLIKAYLRKKGGRSRK